MKIKYYGYNTFIIMSDDKKIAIDPGGSFYFPDLFKTIIPKSEWKDITHIVVTHGDPDHHWHTDRVAKESNAYIICNEKMIRDIGGRKRMLGPRDKGLAFTFAVDNPYTLGENETIEAGGIEIAGFKGNHGPLTIKIGPFSKTLTPGENERIGHGEMVYKINIHGKVIVNFGDTLLLEDEWKTITGPDVLMIPIGGYSTMDAQDAVKAVKSMAPKIVIPCHYNCPGIFSKCYNYADTKLFKSEVEKAGAQCILMSAHDEITV